MEDALSLRDALDAAPRYRVVRTVDGFDIEPGSADDDLFDLDQCDAIIWFSLERGYLVSTDERVGLTPSGP